MYFLTSPSTNQSVLASLLKPLTPKFWGFKQGNQSCNLVVNSINSCHCHSNIFFCEYFIPIGNNFKSSVLFNLKVFRALGTSYVQITKNLPHQSHIPLPIHHHFLSTVIHHRCLQVPNIHTQCRFLKSIH